VDNRSLFFNVDPWENQEGDVKTVELIFKDATREWGAEHVLLAGTVTGKDDLPYWVRSVLSLFKARYGEEDYPKHAKNSIKIILKRLFDHGGNTQEIFHLLKLISEEVVSTKERSLS